ncbi:hypothetical protein ElyMa_000204100 [Elysia marginata]|uniref:Uncharacterized protein n=1 Tax=Elysia marginata TaxID=1093978 RepID=A0AAV4EWM5_9GAST|nr:hypothetical protein ElyMa_000204100 [Elysia marginata]
MREFFKLQIIKSFYKRLSRIAEASGNPSSQRAAILSFFRETEQPRAHLPPLSTGDPLQGQRTPVAQSGLKRRSIPILGDKGDDENDGDEDEDDDDDDNDEDDDVQQVAV